MGETMKSYVSLIFLSLNPLFAEAECVSLQDFTWLSGNWVAEGNDNYKQQWTMGQTRLDGAEQTPYWRGHYHIGESDEQIVLVVDPDGSSPRVYPVTYCAAERIVFGTGGRSFHLLKTGGDTFTDIIWVGHTGSGVRFKRSN